MTKYISYSQLERQMKTYIQDKFEELPFTEALGTFLSEKAYTTQKNKIDKRMLFSEEDFISAIYRSQICIDTFMKEDSTKEDSSLIPDSLDVFAIKHLTFSKQNQYKHQSFNINYAYKGSAILIFDNKERIMEEGDLCIIAPNSKYKIIPENDETIILDIFIRKSTFDKIFVNALMDFEVISLFLRNIIYNTDTHENYLLFSANESHSLREIVQNIFIETNYEDPHSNKTCIYWVNLLFVVILRNFEFKYCYYNLKNERSENFYKILEYIQNNYSSVTLQSLAEKFNYNESYLSSQFRRISNLTFIEYLTDIKLNHAKSFLLNTDYSVSSISELVGYNCTDHFSRTFKKKFSDSPSKFREHNSKQI